MTTLGEIGEDELIRRLTRGLAGAPGLLVGPGDDCAVWHEPGGQAMLLKTDAIVEGVHFLPEAAPAAVGWKAIARVASDMAAMGGYPEAFLVTIGLRADLPVAWVEDLYAGIGRALQACGGVLAGGETTAVPGGAAMFLSVAATGRTAGHQPVLRSTGTPGDLLAVTGTLGGTLAGKHLDFEPRLAQGAWLARHGARAMMDLSDGLGRDLPRLAAASGCGWRLDEARVPCAPGCTIAAALGDGEDYELLVALPPERAAQVLAEWPGEFPRVPLTIVGELTAAACAAAPAQAGWEHFRRG